jgi:hypothetical protein
MIVRNITLAAVMCAASFVTISAATVPVQAEQAVPAEKNPPGDIPDTQVFVQYQGAGVTMKVPEGWARTDEAAGAIFADKYNGLEVTTITSTAPLTAASVTNNEAKSLAAGRGAIKITSVKDVKLDGGMAVRVDYSANSAPNPVTNKQIRLEEVRFYLQGSGGHVAVLDMSAPLGADNVDQWNLMANSLRVK